MLHVRRQRDSQSYAYRIKRIPKQRKFVLMPATTHVVRHARQAQKYVQQCIVRGRPGKVQQKVRRGGE